MGGFIDRDPQGMMKYGRDAKQIVEEMSTIIRKVEAILETAAPDLDDHAQKEIEKLKECCAKYYKEIKVYTNVADEVYNKGKRLHSIRNGG